MSAFAWTSMGSSLLQGWSSRYAQKIDMKLQQYQHTYDRTLTGLNNQVQQQQADIANRLRAGQNKIMLAQAHAENAMRRISNKRVLQRTTVEHEQQTENFLRQQEALSQGGLEDQIKAAEQRGAYAANSALSGTLGSTIDGMENSLVLKQQRAGEYLDRQGNYATYDQLRQLAGITPNGISQLDTGQSIAMLDHGYSFAQQRPLGPEHLVNKPTIGNFFTDAFAWSLSTEDGFRQIGSTVNNWFTPSKTVPNYPGAEY